MIELGWYGYLQLIIFVDDFSGKIALPHQYPPYSNKVFSALIHNFPPLEDIFREEAIKKQR
jgi:hypothetical protein